MGLKNNGDVKVIKQVVINCFDLHKDLCITKNAVNLFDSVTILEFGLVSVLESLLQQLSGEYK